MRRELTLWAHAPALAADAASEDSPIVSARRRTRDIERTLYGLPICYHAEYWAI
jgi:hypothetical protein